jgi:hypothetical protein
MDDFLKKNTWNWWNSFRNSFEHICLQCVFDLENLSLRKIIQSMDA